jgi:hypothetical protein
MNKNLLQEELSRFRMMVNYDPSKTINEQASDSIPMLKGDTIKTGMANTKNTTNAPGIGAPPIAMFKNDGIVSGYKDSEKVYLFMVETAGFLGKKLPYESEEISDITPEPDKDVLTLKIDFDLQDPFVFDRTELTTQGEDDYQNFILDYNEKKEANMTLWDNYLSFLKSKGPFNIIGYSSIDGDPDKIVANSNNKKTKTYPPCRVPGGRRREEYNKCLAQARAEAIVRKLESDIPELKGLFTPVGFGETKMFKDSGWPDETSTRQKTAPNRRFVLSDLPEYDETFNVDKTSDTKTSEKETPKKEEPTINYYGDSVEKFGPRVEGDYYYYYGNYIPKGDIQIGVNRNVSPPHWTLYQGKNIIGADGSTQRTYQERDMVARAKAGIERKENITPPDGYWIAGDMISDIDSDIEIPYYEAPENKSNILVSEEDLKTYIGDDFGKYIPDTSGYSFEGTESPNVKLNSTGVNIEGYTFKGWDEPMKIVTAENAFVVGRTDFKPSIVKVTTEGGVKMYEIGSVGFNLAIAK